MVWYNKPSLEDLNQRSESTMAEHMGIVFVEVGQENLKAQMPVDQRTRQPLGILNGGASCALAETVASTAANYCVDQTVAYCVGLSLTANHVRSVRSGYVVATATAVHIGKSTHVWNVDICDEADKRICTVRMTMAVLTRK